MARLTFRTFRGRLSFIFLSLIALLLGASFLIVQQANRRNALRQIEANLRTGSRIFATLAERRLDELNEQARLLAYDYGFKQAFGSAADDRATIRLAMQNWRDRIRASFMVLVSLDQQTLYDSEDPARDGTAFDLPHLLNAAEESDKLEARGLMLRDGSLYAAVIVPLLAPQPVAWICLGFKIDDAFARELGSLTNLEVSFIEQRADDSSPRALASTLPPPGTQQLLRAVPSEARTPVRLTLGDVPFVTLVEPLDLRNGRGAVALQRNFDQELAPFRTLENALLLIGGAGLLLAAAAVTGIAASLSRPVLRLARQTRRVEAGDYSPQPGAELHRRDELGQLARAFGHMTAGLAERDKVRDLLGKVVSPAIAAELTRRQLKLGGEEKKVTVLFCDLRDFTPISERMSPTQLLEVLNAYLTTMSEFVDARGGVVDKYIGDAVMALFGAPIELPAQAAQACHAALDMLDALSQLNARLFPAGEHQLRIGIGIHTGIAVAGNVGAPQRYNYTVTGDTVNIASRVESLTRKPEYDTSIIITESTLAECGELFQTRPLGPAAVKGREQSIGIHALLALKQR